MRFINHERFLKTILPTATYFELMCDELKEFEYNELAEECEHISALIKSFYSKIEK